MDKYGIKKEILYQELRNEEALLMQRVQSDMMDKTAEERRSFEVRLQQVRGKITELDLGDQN